MELKTKINAEDGEQELMITREFDLPLELLFKAYVEPEIVEQWMGTKVLKLDSCQHGSTNSKHPIPREMWYFVPTGRSTSSFLSRELPGHLKWRTRRFPSSLSFLSLEYSLTKPANSLCR